MLARSPDVIPNTLCSDKPVVIATLVAQGPRSQCPMSRNRLRLLGCAHTHPSNAPCLGARPGDCACTRHSQSPYRGAKSACCARAQHGSSVLASTRRFWLGLPPLSPALLARVRQAGWRSMQHRVGGISASREGAGRWQRDEALCCHGAARSRPGHGRHRTLLARIGLEIKCA